MKTEKPLLREEIIYPTNEVLKSVLCDSYVVFEELTSKITNDFGLILEWNYYKDQQSWLCKVLNKKKNVFWLSVWDKFFKATFFFTEKHLEGFSMLDVSENIKENLCMSKPIGKLLPLLLDINSKNQLEDLLKIVEFKKSLK
jgi:hypothetical protein